MKKALEASLPEESQEDITARIKKEVMAKMERTLYEMKHARSELAKELRLEQASNHKANTVIAQLELEVKETKEQIEALRDQIRFAMKSEQEKTAQVECKFHIYMHVNQLHTQTCRTTLNPICSLNDLVLGGCVGEAVL